jgi:hypothetical protein
MKQKKQKNQENTHSNVTPKLSNSHTLEEKSTSSQISSDTLTYGSLTKPITISENY